MKFNQLELNSGKPYPLGNEYDRTGINFAIYSKHAEKVELCLFDEENIETRYILPGRTDNIWHGFLFGGKPGLRYGYRIHGPWDPQKGMRFNPYKLLIDPYSQALSHKIDNNPLFIDGEFEFNKTDNSDIAPKSIVIHEPYDWQYDTLPKIPWSETIIYEAHVRGFTKLHPGIADDLQGTYAALAQPVIINYLLNLGITTLELLPVQLHIDEPRLQKIKLTNYWGYNVLAPFAIEPLYWSGQKGTTPLSEFRDMVKALHEAGIEVILDMVFNHTAELDVTGPTLSLRGIDNSTYYWLNDAGGYENWTGCGNTLRLNHPITIQWVIDCLHFWTKECHVDGFRFDLGTVLGRTPDFTSAAPLLNALTKDPILSTLKLIAEPWDIGCNGYQLGQFPYPFAEWNDRFRDDIRRFILKKGISLGTLACRFSGSSDIFQRNGRLPFASINKITSHDGFTLRDLVSFEHKHNAQNGEENRDGNDNNCSNNHGYEGLLADKHIEWNRNKSTRNLLTLLLLSLGTPMLLAGDEMGNSQQGNNNAYCQDSELSWVNWSDKDNNLIAFTSELIALRKKIISLIRGQWWTGEISFENNSKDIDWLNYQAEPMSVEEWQSNKILPLQIMLSDEWLVIINLTEEPQYLKLPDGAWGYIKPFSESDALINSQNYLIDTKKIEILQKK